MCFVVFLSCARWYKKHDEKSEAPKGFVGMMEMFVMMIHDDVIKSSIGEKHYRTYAPYLLTVFFFIFTTNTMGVGFGLGLNTFSIIMLLFMNLLEVLVAFVQAYVFTMLSAVFIGLGS